MQNRFYGGEARWEWEGGGEDREDIGIELSYLWIQPKVDYYAIE